LDSTITDLRVPLNITTDLAKVIEELEKTHLILLKEAIDVEDTRRCVHATVNEYNTAQGYTPAGMAPVEQVKFASEVEIWARS
jgi:hypothetical protein